MRTLRNTGSERLLGIALVMLVAVALGGCGSSSSTAPTSSSTTSALSPSSETRAPAPSTSSTSSSAPVPSTIPRSSQASCSALISALSVSDLRLRNSGNWTAERQRILSDTASNVELFSTAITGVPSDIASAIKVLSGYSAWLGDTVASASSFEAANSAVNSYPDSSKAANATAVVDGWKRANC